MISNYGIKTNGQINFSTTQAQVKVILVPELREEDPYRGIILEVPEDLFIPFLEGENLTHYRIRSREEESLRSQELQSLQFELKCALEGQEDDIAMGTYKDTIGKKIWREGARKALGLPPKKDIEN